MVKNFLTFSIDNNICAVEISCVLEVLNCREPTPIPCAEPYIEGLIYSRDQGITVINLRKKFGLKKHQNDKNTKTIVIEINTVDEEGEKNALYGLIADNVLDVISADDELTVKSVKTSIPKQNISKIIKTEDNKNIIVLSFEDL